MPHRDKLDRRILHRACSAAHIAAYLHNSGRIPCPKASNKKSLSAILLDFEMSLYCIYLYNYQEQFTPILTTYRKLKIKNPIPQFDLRTRKIKQNCKRVELTANYECSGTRLTRTNNNQ